MPIFSRRFSLWTRLYGRMLLEPTSSPGVMPQVSEVVVPVIQADALLKTPVADQSSVDLSGGAKVAGWTVPAGEEWHLKVLVRYATSAASQISLEISGTSCTLVAQQTAQVIMLPNELNGLILREDDAILFYNTAQGGDSSITIQIIYDKVDLSL